LTSAIRLLTFSMTVTPKPSYQRIPYV
jgi:hypothetical protein